MTHDELLAKIDEIEIKTNNTALLLGVQTALLTQNKALRSVVQLHKPERITIEGFKTEYWCMADNNEPTPYPCLTILQIEKELK